MCMRKYRVIILLLAVLFLTPGRLPKPAQEPPLLRLHIRANSDAPTDQAVKLKVRNAVLAALELHLQRAGDVAQAEAQAEDALPRVQAAAEAVLADNGMKYPVRVALGPAEFPTRRYGGTVYRAGRYRALQVYLGDGGGANWWCVLFPPLCFVEVAGNAVPVAQEAPEPIRPRSRFMEWLQRLFGLQP